MKKYLQHIIDLIHETETLSPEQKSLIIKSLKDVDKELSILEFKLDRTEKVKRTTSILLEETIEELEQKRKAVEESNAALQKTIEELKATQAQLIQSEKMASLGELTAGIAHEIQNPLNFVNNFSEVSNELIQEIQDIRRKTQEKGAESEEDELLNDIANNLKKILHHGKRADAIVKGMLQHSRTSRGQKELTDINALCDEYLRLSYHGLRAKDKSFNANFETDFDLSLPQINVVPQDIGRVVLNLINNAFYTTNEKRKTNNEGYEPTITVSTKKEGNKVSISVKDNGNGIPNPSEKKSFNRSLLLNQQGRGLVLAYH
jgi:two-component system, NtrC family, sensor kinase